MSKRPERRIKKVKLTDEHRIEIHYEKRSATGGWDYYTVCSGDGARAEFYMAIERLAGHATDMCELPAEYLPVEIRSIRFTHSGMYGTLGATMCFRKRLRGGAYLHLETPHRYSEPHQKDGDRSICLSQTCVDDLTRVMREAMLYVDGHRNQLGFQFAAPARTPAKPKAGVPARNIHSQLSTMQ